MQSRYFSAAVHDGTLQVIHSRLVYAPGETPGIELSELPVPEDFGYGVYEFAGGVAVRVPAWLVALTLTLLPARWGWVWHRLRVLRRQKAGGLCFGCGYDLRESPERCPECGRAVA